MSRLYIVTLLIYVLLYAEYIMQNAELDEAQVGIKIARRNSCIVHAVAKSQK